MGLTKRRDSYYVEFPVLDNGKTLMLARGIAGAKLKRGRDYSDRQRHCKHGIEKPH